MSPRSPDLKAWTVLCVATAAAAALLWAAPAHLYDDAFITLRYVANSKAGHGLVYNPGQHVCGVSSPLHLCLLAAASRVLPWLDPVQLALGASSLAFLSCGLLAFLLLRRWTASPLLSAAGALLLLLHPALLAVCVGGLEAWLFVALALTSLLLAPARPSWAAVVAGLATLTRPEGCILLAVLLLGLRRHRRRAQLGACAWFLVPILPWVVAAWLYYGTPIPHSILAKARPLYPLPLGTALLDILRQFGAVGMSVILAATALAVKDLLRGGSKLPPPAWIPAAWYWGTFLLYAAGNPFVAAWYWPALQVPAILLVSTALGSLAHRLPAGWFVVAALATAGIGFMTQGWQARYNTPDRLRVVAYRQLGAKLCRRAGAGDTVCTSEVGALGYAFSGRILDGCGLVSPETLPYLPVPADQRAGPRVGALPVGLVRAQRPEWVVSLPIFIRKSLLASDWFLSEYELVFTWPLIEEVWGDQEMRVYRRRVR